MLIKRQARLSRVSIFCLSRDVDIPNSLRLSADWELVFADDEREANPTSFKFLQMAHAWKNTQARRTGGSDSLSGFTSTVIADAGSNSDAGVEKGHGGDDDVRSDTSSSVVD